MGIAPLLMTGNAARSSSAAEEAVERTEQGWRGLVRSLVIGLISQKYVDDEHWGQTQKVASDVLIRTKKGQTRFERREKDVNHGVWRRSSIRLLKPEKTFRLEFRNVRQTDDGATRFDLFVQCRARVDSQFAVWNLGVKGLNGSFESDVTLQALLDCSFKIESAREADHLLPELTLRPKIHDLDLKLKDVDTRKAGPLGGWVAEQLGDTTRKAVEEILQSQESRILTKIRKALDKHADDLRLDLGQISSLWKK
jgi:hypothetical protein